MKKAPEKTKEEKTAENYFPVDTTDLKYTTEKIEKAPPKREEVLRGSIEKEYKKPERTSLETIEKINPIKKKTRKKRITKKRNTKTTIKKFIPQKITLKKTGYELIITEKPQAASKIAQALGKATQKTDNKISYYEVNREGKQIIVACAVGHLLTLKQNVPGSSVPIFDISWVPNYLANSKASFTKKYYNTLLKLAKNAGSLTVATDYDIEGEVIGMNIVRFICNQKDANRMKFSTLTEQELNEAYENKSKHIDWGQAIAGETRHHLDWYYGINLSRALMNAIKTTGKFRIMSIGRVQGPALNLIVQRERKIQTFKPEPYWQVFINIQKEGEKPFPEKLKHNKDIFNKNDLPQFEGLIGKTVEAKTKKTEQIIPPNPPFNLTTLQTESYKFYGLTPSKTLQIAQSLYLAGLISYPRTSSQKLPASIGYKEILKKLAKEYDVEKLITKNKPIEGKKSDSAHPSIYPTGNKQILSGDEEKIYNLIVKRFLSLFCDDAIIDNKKVSVTTNNLLFSANGSSIRKKAWLEIYPSKSKHVEIPDLEGPVKIIDLKTEEKETQPPKRYSPASIISELEKRNLGTKATRSSILETLHDRGYIEGQSLKATPLGISLIDTLNKYSPIIIDENLTKEFESEMQSIQKIDNKTKQEEKEEKIITKAKKTITQISKDFEKSKNQIGQELVNANLKFREQQKRENTLIKCPVCNKGDLAITYSKKTKRFFVACNAYPECKTTYSLPPNGQIKKTDKICEHCGFPMLMRLSKGKRPWIFCWNRECPTNKEWAQKTKKD